MEPQFAVFQQENECSVAERLFRLLGRIPKHPVQCFWRSQDPRRFQQELGAMDFLFQFVGGTRRHDSGARRIRHHENPVLDDVRAHIHLNDGLPEAPAKNISNTETVRLGRASDENDWRHNTLYCLMLYCASDLYIAKQPRGATTRRAGVTPQS